MAIALTLVYFSRPATVDGLMINGLVLYGEPWRLLTSTLLHGDVLHLAFNIYWLWVFGTALEERFGHFLLLVAMAVAAAVASAAEYAVFGNSIGLSGVGYAMFGASWMLARYDHSLRDLVDLRTVQLMLAWGVLCILTTMLNIFPVANLAHGMGLAFGVTVGLALARSRWWWLAATAVMVVTALSVTLWRSTLNLEPVRSAEELAYRASEASATRPQRSLRLLRAAIDMNDLASYHAQLGDLFQQMGKPVEARASYATACERDNAYACSRLAYAVEMGLGGAADPRAAANYYCKACGGKEPIACSNLARLHELGLGVPASLELATSLYELACKSGHAHACKRLQALGKAVP